MKSTSACAAVLIGLALASIPSLSHGQTAGMALDQANDHFGYYFYDRPSAWQSFTAGVNGHLAAVQAYVYSTNGANWSATFEIRKGEGASGALLASQTVTGDGVNQQRTFVLEVPPRQTSGDTYTFVFRNVSTGVTVRASANNYADGRSHHANYDYNFKTWVLASDWSEEAWRDTSFTASSTVIGTAAQLAQFAWLVNNGITFAGQTLTLAADIDLSAHYWVPAGSRDIRFGGTFDGAGRSVRGVYIDRPEADYQGLFGSTDADAVIRDLAVTNLDIAAASYVGGVVGRAYGGVTNCSAHGRVSGAYMVGGVAGCAEGALLACANHADVTGLNGVGGVAGLARSGASDCRNSGAVSGNNDIGGVAGYAAADVTSCVNSGPVVANEGERTGGVAGSCGGNLFGCRNSGSVSGPATVGGIVGDPADGTVDRCFNSGAVSGGTAGGIAAITGGAIRNCANSGTVSVSAGGYEAGGIVGYIWGGTVMNCANNGGVSGADDWNNVGGLIGWNDGCTLANAANSGAVSGLGVLGGLVGRNESWGTAANSYWKRTGAAPFALDAVGDNLGTAAACQSFGAAPGTLAAPVTVDGLTTGSLPGALNAWMAMTRDDEGLPLRRWTPGSAAAYPTIVETRWTDAGNFTTNWYSAAETNFFIDTASELAGLAVLVNAGIRFQDQRVTLAADIALGEREWTPVGWLDEVGEPVSYFAGEFDGNGKTVSGVYVDERSELLSAGFFGVAGWAIVANLSIADADVAGDLYAGALFGYLGFSWIINNSCGGRVSGEAAGGIAGATVGGIVNCWSDVRVSGDIAGGLVGSLMEEGEAVGYSYWKRTGTAPYDLPAVGDREDETLPDCHAFAEAPGLLDVPPELAPLTLSQALNDIIKEFDAINGIGLYGWTAGSATDYPALTALIRVSGEFIQETLSDGFTAGLTLAQVDAGVAVYTNAHPATTADTFGPLMRQADALGFTFAELAAGDAILAFCPSLVLTAFDPGAWSLTFTVGNGIDATAVQAMDRLAASPAKSFAVCQMAEPGGAGTPVTPTVRFNADGTAEAAFTPARPADRAFFRLLIAPAD